MCQAVLRGSVCVFVRTVCIDNVFRVLQSDGLHNPYLSPSSGQGRKAHDLHDTYRVNDLTAR